MKGIRRGNRDEDSKLLGMEVNRDQRSWPRWKDYEERGRAVRSRLVEDSKGDREAL